MKKKLKLKYKIRRSIAAIVIFFIIIFGFNVIGKSSNQVNEERYICEEYVVGKNEVFWNIANRYIDSSISKWDYIDACQKINDKQLGNLKAGEVIKVITNFKKGE